jgi:hypothetical protein
MRAFVIPLLLVPLVLIRATPAAAQPFRDLTLSQDAQRAAEARAARSRDISTGNDQTVRDAGAQTDKALSNIAAARVNPAVPTIPFNPAAPPPKIDASQMAEIPDATLAASNARARAAADNRR